MIIDSLKEAVFVVSYKLGVLRIRSFPHSIFYKNLYLKMLKYKNISDS